MPRWTPFAIILTLWTAACGGEHADAAPAPTLLPSGEVWHCLRIEDHPGVLSAGDCWRDLGMCEAAVRVNADLATRDGRPDPRGQCERRDQAACYTIHAELPYGVEPWRCVTELDACRTFREADSRDPSRCAVIH